VQPARFLLREQHSSSVARATYIYTYTYSYIKTHTQPDTHICMHIGFTLAPPVQPSFFVAQTTFFDEYMRCRWKEQGSAFRRIYILYIYIHVCIHTHTNIHIYPPPVQPARLLLREQHSSACARYIYIYIHIHTYIHPHNHTPIHIHICTYIHIPFPPMRSLLAFCCSNKILRRVHATYIYICVYIYICICIYVFLYLYTHTHLYIYTAPAPPHTPFRSLLIYNYFAPAQPACFLLFKQHPAASARVSGGENRAELFATYICIYSYAYSHTGQPVYV